MNRSQDKAIYFITGASGVGKTTLLDQLKEKYASRPWLFFHFDSIGIPSLTEMEKEFGSPSEWQKAKTLDWIISLIRRDHGSKIFIEGQTDLRFIREGFAKHNFRNYHIVLVDCSEEEMEQRLTHSREQPELFTEPMKNWLRYLRAQALESNVLLLDTSAISPEETLQKFERLLGLE